MKVIALIVGFILVAILIEQLSVSVALLLSIPVLGYVVWVLYKAPYRNENKPREIRRGK